MRAAVGALGALLALGIAGCSLSPGRWLPRSGENVIAHQAEQLIAVHALETPGGFNFKMHPVRVQIVSPAQATAEYRYGGGTITITFRKTKGAWTPVQMVSRYPADYAIPDAVLDLRGEKLK